MPAHPILTAVAAAAQLQQHLDAANARAAAAEERAAQIQRVCDSLVSSCEERLQMLSDA